MQARLEVVFIGACKEKFLPKKILKKEILKIHPKKFPLQH